jgi:hypothetical protein
VGIDGFYSRPDRVTDSYESRRFLPERYPQEGKERNAQTELYENHWALMNSQHAGAPSFRPRVKRDPSRAAELETARLELTDSATRSS